MGRKNQTYLLMIDHDFLFSIQINFLLLFPFLCLLIFLSFMNLLLILINYDKIPNFFYLVDYYELCEYQKVLIVMSHLITIISIFIKMSCGSDHLFFCLNNLQIFHLLVFKVLVNYYCFQNLILN